MYFTFSSYVVFLIFLSCNYYNVTHSVFYHITVDYPDNFFNVFSIALFIFLNFIMYIASNIMRISNNIMFSFSSLLLL